MDWKGDAFENCQNGQTAILSLHLSKSTVTQWKINILTQKFQQKKNTQKHYEFQLCSRALRLDGPRFYTTMHTNRVSAFIQQSRDG